MLKEWIQLAKERGASDLHLESGTPLVLRARGELLQLGTPIPGHTLLDEARALLDEEQWEDFLERRSADLSKTLSGVRCRINLFQTVKGIGFAVRLLSSFQNNLRDCNLLPELGRLVGARSGLVIVSGPTGSGKSTTLAALVEEINATQGFNILTLENPIEYFFTNRKSFIRQREIPSHSPSFEQAILDSMRENPDVLVIGEMRTPEVMRLTLNAAETGHLVLATMHSSSCAEAISRLCMSFPAEIQPSIRAQVADCLVGVVCQRLTYLPKLQIRVPVCEILTATVSAKSTIRTGQFSQILSVLQTGGEEGTWTFDRYQRWVDQKKDWVRPGQARPLEDRPRTAPGSASAPKEMRRAASSPKQERGSKSKGDDGRVEISSVDDDLESLARQISGDKGED